MTIPTSRRAKFARMSRFFGVGALSVTLLTGCPFLFDLPPEPPQTVTSMDAGGSFDTTGWPADAGPADTSPTGSGPADTGQLDAGWGTPFDSGQWPDTEPANEPDMWQRQPGNFPNVIAALVIGNDTPKPRVIRLRRLIDTVNIDCAAIANAPNLALRPVHFEAAKSWLVPTGRAIPVQPRSAKHGCSAVLIEGTGLPTRLLYWPHNQFPTTSLSTTVSGASNTGRMVPVTVDEGTAAWGKHAALFGAPSLFDPIANVGCQIPNPEGDLSWTDLPGGSHTIIELLTAPDGCSAIDLLTNAGVQRVYVCVPPGTLPFKMGDDLYIAALATGHNVLPITGVELLADKAHLRMGRGSDLVYFGKGDAKVAAKKGCPALHDTDGTYARALSAMVDLPGKSAVELANGASMTVDGGGHLRLIRAVDRLVYDSAVAPKLQGARHIESVWSKP
ncbi:MAG: hypothetical protein KC502_09170 [Myxococcales bacterium]|nr:hypothetical protein [Myxococcales bacterium]